MSEKSLEEMFASTLLKDSTEKLQDIVSNKITEIEKQLVNKIDRMQDRVEEKVSNLEQSISEKPLTVNLGTVDKPKEKLVHNAFNTVLDILKSAKRIEKNIMLVGECGSGKSSLCADIAEALKLEFYPMSVGLQTTKSDLLGFINAKGDYITTPVRQAFENGGVLLLDEFDATHAGVITILNSMLANGICSFPDKIVEKNPNFICIVACNTYGKGGSIDYIGRNRLDSATLDRFITVSVDYDINLEEKLVNNSGWMKIINKIRGNIQKQGLKVIVSPRASMQGADLLDSGFKIEDVIDMCIFKGCSKDVRTKLLEGVDLSKINKKRLSKKKKSVNPNKPIEISINFDVGTYNCVNVQDSTSIISEADWKGEYNIYISSRSEWASSSLDNCEIFLNCGKSLPIYTSSSKYVEKFINTLSVHSDSIIIESQPIILSVIYNGYENIFRIGV